jgi:hypothetical protein
METHPSCNGIRRFLAAWAACAALEWEFFGSFLLYVAGKPAKVHLFQPQSIRCVLSLQKYMVSGRCYSLERADAEEAARLQAFRLLSAKWVGETVFLQLFPICTLRSGWRRSGGRLPGTPLSR